MGRGRVWDWLREGAGTGAGKVKEEKGVLWLFFVSFFYLSVFFLPTFFSHSEFLFQP